MQNFDIKEISTFDELVDFLPKDLSESDLGLIRRAYEFANQSHQNTKLRVSGKTQMSHCLNVAKYVAQLNLDAITIASALLHDVIEKGSVSVDELDKLFGTDIAFIVNGVSQIRKLSGNVDTQNQEVDMEDFKKMIFSATEDVRTIIIRLAEKLHNILNIQELDDEQKMRAANRGIKIYATLAEYLGLGVFQTLIEENAFKTLKPRGYQIITSEIDKYFVETKDVFNDFENQVKDLLNQYKIHFYPIQLRKKSIYSAYLKIKRKFLTDGSELEPTMVRNLFDIYASRIIVSSVEECYMVLGLMQSKFGIINPEEFDDYIANPKASGYKSIHFITPFKNIKLEVQIRTLEMHEFNEYGPASHAIYKLKSKGQKKTNKSFTLTEDLMKWKEEGKDGYRIKLFADSVFVFTPKGLVIRLDKGSTPIDFAFRIHTDVGYKYIGAKVNGKMVSMDYKLQTGDVIEILTQKKDNTNIDWLKHAFMTETKARIRKKL
jgi:GTP diphosphokinase / guanosine-3',5'-bis(diphosphate) 3'-diphosphatase